LSFGWKVNNVNRERKTKILNHYERGNRHTSWTLKTIRKFLQSIKIKGDSLESQNKQRRKKELE